MTNPNQPIVGKETAPSLGQDETPPHRKVTIPKRARYALAASLLLVPRLSTLGSTTTEHGEPPTTTTQRLIQPDRHDQVNKTEGRSETSFISADGGQAAPNQEGAQSLDDTIRFLGELEKNGTPLTGLEIEGKASDDKTIGQPDPYNERIAQERAKRVLSSVSSSGIKLPPDIKLSSGEVVSSISPSTEQQAKQRGVTITARWDETTEKWKLTDGEQNRGRTTRTTSGTADKTTRKPAQLLKVEEGVLPKEVEVVKEGPGRRKRNKGRATGKSSAIYEKSGGRTTRPASLSRSKPGNLSSGRRTRLGSISRSSERISRPKSGERSPSSDEEQSGRTGSGFWPTPPYLPTINPRGTKQPRPVELTTLSAGVRPEGTVGTVPITSAPRNLNHFKVGRQKYDRDGMSSGKNIPTGYPRKQRPKQPRNHNFSKTKRKAGGRMNRNHGGSRSDKRG